LRQDYHQVRPHEALGMQTPASVYTASEREYPCQVPEPEYPLTMLVRTIHSKGHFRWKERRARPYTVPRAGLAAVTRE